VRAAIPVALELPCREAADVDMKYFQSRRAAPVGRSLLRLIQATGILCATAGVTSWK